MGERTLNVWTAGHSTRSIREFIELLEVHEIEALVDVRRFPASRKYPHFNKHELSESLADAGIGYLPLPELGGRRRPQTDSRNTVWRNESFRGYADYMETEEFRAGAGRLLEIAGGRRTAIMCAEAVWWRCHRALIADFLKAKGVEVHHIIDSKKCESHPYTSAARLVHGKLTYTPEG
jgi:uncharacterized protein (DUF488 family)